MKDLKKTLHIIADRLDCYKPLKLKCVEKGINYRDGIKESIILWMKTKKTKPSQVGQMTVWQRFKVTTINEDVSMTEALEEAILIWLTVQK